MAKDIIYQLYHKHDDYTNPVITDSVSTLEDYAKQAKEYGHGIISSCAHGTQGNYWLCSELAEKYGLKWRYVSEAYFVKDRQGLIDGKRDNTNCHMILAAKTRKGVGDLNYALSEANISGFYYHPRIDLDILSTLDPKDVFITTACVGGIFKYGFKEAELLIQWLNSHFKGSFMLEVQAHEMEKQITVNEFLLSMYRKYGIPLIAATDSHYVKREDERLRQQRLEANHIVYEDESGVILDYPSGEELYQRFKQQGILSDIQIREAMDNTNVFLDFEDIVLDKSKKIPNIYPSLTQEQRNEKYKELVYQKWDEYKQSVSPADYPRYEEGIAYEVNTITETNTSDYFLFDYEMVKEGKKLGGVLTKTGRGSGPSYFTNTLLGFSSIDRFALPVTMYPDRFISKDRLLAGSLPDLDLNVADPEPFEQAQTKVLGEWHSAKMVAFGKLSRLSAWKMYCRAENIPYELANDLSKHLKNYELDYKHADEDEKDELNPYDYIPAEYHEQLRMSEKYLGLIDNISPHPCAYLLCTEDIRREIGIYRINSKTGKKKTIYAAYIDGATAERFGYLKNDLLTVAVVDINAKAYKRAGIPQPSVPELLKMTENDDGTWSMYAKGYTMGLNQVEQEKSSEKVMRYKPRNISELSAFVAGIRPAFQSMVNKLLDREHFDYAISTLDNLLQTKEMPSSFILYQEQMMTVLQYGGFSAPESYASIKAIAKKHPEKVLPLKQRFLDGFKQKLVEDGTDESIATETAEQVWVIISDACGYGFNSCLVGSTKILRPSNGRNGIRPTIAEMYRIKQDYKFAVETGHKSLHKKYKCNGYGNALSLCSDGRIRENKIVDIYYQGIRDVYEVTTASGRKVICTDNHKFPIGTSDNLVQLKDLKVGDRLFAMGEYEVTKNTRRFTKTQTDNYPLPGQKGFQPRPDGNSVVFHRVRNEKVDEKAPCEICGCEYKPEEYFELHHVDGDSTNNSPDNFCWSCNSCHKKDHYRNHGRVGRYQKGIPSVLDEIVSIQYVGKEEVYDVEMADPNHNFVLSDGLVTGNSHSVSVGLDSLYGAYLKAHYPMAYYTTLLSHYSQKGDKERIMKIRIEMKKAFGISMVPCRYRQDNRDYFIDMENNTISDALTSCKYISAKVASRLCDMSDNVYFSFVDVLYDMTMDPAFNTRQMKALIKMGYFDEFGHNGKLLKLFYEFTEGKNKFAKTLVPASQEKRINALYDIEDSLEDTALPMAEQLSFEYNHYGAPMTIDPSTKGIYVAIDVDDKYSPKITLYSVATGRTGVMRTKKKLYLENQIQKGDIIKLNKWTKKPQYKFSDGKPEAIPGTSDIWMDGYSIIYRDTEENS